MALWSLFVDVENVLRYSTQVSAIDAEAAVAEFLALDSLKDALAAHTDKGWPPSFSTGDVFLLIPMDGLTNMYLCQLGRAGKYVSITLARTVPADSQD